MSRTLTARASGRRWLACIAILAATLLGGLAIAPPAHAADFYGYGAFPGPYSYQGAAFQSGCCGCPRCGCAPCGCGPCGCWQCGCCGPIYLPPRPVIERHVINHEFYERRFGGYPYPAYAYNPFPYGYGGVRSNVPYAGYGYYDGPPGPVGSPAGYYDGYGQ